MRSFGNAASSHSGLIPLKTSYNKRGELLWAIVSETNFINLHSAAFVTVFARSLVHAYKFCIFKKISRTLKTGKAVKQDLKYDQFFPPVFVFTSEHPQYSLALFSSLICTCKFSKEIEFASKRTSVRSPEYANNWVKKLVIYYNITATLCKSFCDVITRGR